MEIVARLSFSIPFSGGNGGDLKKYDLGRVWEVELATGLAKGRNDVSIAARQAFVRTASVACVCTGCFRFSLSINLQCWLLLPFL